ncbi:MAG: hypothetical protein GY719_06180 [bacterium]|nr:hypothetical protein [bacterium]
MPLTKAYAQDLLRKRPRETTVLLLERKYWDLTFLQVYLDECDRVVFDDDPKAGLELAEAAPKLALMIPKRRPFEWQQHASNAEKQLLRELLMTSHAVLGGAYRALGRFEDAEKAYAVACEICDSGPISPMAKANLYKRMSKLRSGQRRFDEALELVDYAVEVYRDEDPVIYADALNTKGYILGESKRNSEALQCFGQALKLSRPTRKNSSLAKGNFHSIVHNLAAASSEGCSDKDAIRALRYVRIAKRFLAKKRNSVAKQKLAWVEGRITATLGSTRYAERLLLRTLKAFLKLGAPFEAALVGLEVSVIYLQEGQWTKLRELAEDTYKRFRELSADKEAVATLKLWVEGAKKRTLSEASISSALSAIEKRIVLGTTQRQT